MFYSGFMKSDTDETDEQKKQPKESARDRRIRAKIANCSIMDRDDLLRANQIIIYDLLDKVSGRYRLPADTADGSGIDKEKMKLSTYRVLIQALDTSNKVLKDIEVSQLAAELDKLKETLQQDHPPGTPGHRPGMGAF